MNFKPFSTSRLPRLIYGSGSAKQLPSLIAQYNAPVLLVTGSQSFQKTPHWDELIAEFHQSNTQWQHMQVRGEPSPTLVDQAVQTYMSQKIGLVVAIGGGSALDAAKAIAGLLPYGNSVLDHLEGVGKNIPYTGPALPFIAVPTTAGTGSEATKNAVLSLQGKDGYKKSFRHETLIPEYAIIDPDLLETCPAELIAADGMDAFTQLLESYVSSKSNPFSDALAWSGLDAVKNGFIAAWQGGDTESAQQGRCAMAYAATLSGITLAQVGLGSVHGLASPLGAYFPIPHGMVCGTLVAAATEMNIKALNARQPGHPALIKYAQLGRFLADTNIASDDQAHQALIQRLNQWTEQLGLKRLSQYGISATDFDKIIANSRGSSMQTNPIVLTDDEIRKILQQRL